MSKLPSMQFYPGDWRKDPGVQSLSYHDRGVWFEVLCLMHESEQRGKLLLAGRAMPDEALARLLGLDNQILTTTLTTLLTFGVASRCETTGALVSRRMVRDEVLRKTRKEAGKLGGNPALLNQSSTTEVKQNSTPSSSSSVSSSELLTSPDGEATPYRQIIELYQTILPACPKVAKLTDARKRHVRARWMDDLSSLDKWRNYFTYVSESDFLTGRKDGRDGRPPFLADFDWLIKQANVVKVAEGKYHRSE